MADLKQKTDSKNPIKTSRLEAFSDGVIAIIITIMVLELKPPHGAEISVWKPLIPVLLAYVLSFAVLAIYWNNHHHLLRATSHISTGVMWANMHLLFWLSLIPIVTAWMGENYNEVWPVVFYSFVGFMCGTAYYILTRTIIKANPSTGIVEAIGSDTKGKISQLIYLLAFSFAFINPYISYVLMVSGAILWMKPDRRLAEV